MDSGGDAGFAGTRRKVRAKLRGYVRLRVDGGEGRSRKTSGGNGGTVAVPDPITPTIPQIMNGIFDEVFTAPELIYYLKQMARFIGLSDDEEAVKEAFDVTPESVFTMLQRKIRHRAPGNAASDAIEGSDHHVRALHAFQAGSSKWVLKITKARDIVVVTLRLLMKAVARNRDAALLSSPRAILEEYVEQVLSSMIADDPELMTLGGRMRVEYRAKLDSFFSKFGDSAHWVESRISKTMESFPDALR